VRLWPRHWNIETLVCSMRGHVTPAATVATLRPGDRELGFDVDVDGDVVVVVGRGDRRAHLRLRRAGFRRHIWRCAFMRALLPAVNRYLGPLVALHMDLMSSDNTEGRRARGWRTAMLACRAARLRNELLHGSIYLLTRIWREQFQKGTTFSTGPSALATMCATESRTMPMSW